MADAAIFIGWGPPVRGREAKGLEVFNESVQTWGQYQEDGKIESFEVVLLNAHGGDLAGFALLRGTREALDELQREEEFQRRTTRAAMIVDNIGVVNAAIGEGLGTQIGVYQDAIGDLT